MPPSMPPRLIVHGLLLATGCGAIALHAQSPSSSGGALITGPNTVLESTDLSVARRRFEPGARSYWHSHARGQLLYVEDGRMWTQRRGEARRELGRGESDYTGPDIVHWHGATAQSPLVQVNVGFGGATRWLEAVTDAQYGK